MMTRGWIGAGELATRCAALAASQRLRLRMKKDEDEEEEREKEEPRPNDDEMGATNDRDDDDDLRGESKAWPCPCGSPSCLLAETDEFGYPTHARSQRASTPAIKGKMRRLRGCEKAQRWRGSGTTGRESIVMLTLIKPQPGTNKTDDVWPSSSPRGRPWPWW